MQDRLDKEARKREEAQRKAQEEQRRAQEEARRAEEERKRQQQQQSKPTGESPRILALKRKMGVSDDASYEEIRKAYKTLSLRLHPDKPGGSTQLFQDLNNDMQEISKFYGKGFRPKKVVGRRL